MISFVSVARHSYQQLSVVGFIPPFKFGIVLHQQFLQQFEIEGLEYYIIKARLTTLHQREQGIEAGHGNCDHQGVHSFDLSAQREAIYSRQMKVNETDSNSWIFLNGNLGLNAV
jgi:hypothetical protein